MEPTRASKPIDPSITGHKLAVAISQPAGCTVSTVSNATPSSHQRLPRHGLTAARVCTRRWSAHCKCTLPHSHAPISRPPPQLRSSEVWRVAPQFWCPSKYPPSPHSPVHMPKFLRQSTRFKFNLPITLGSSSLQRPESLSPQSSSRYYYLYSHVSPGDCVALDCTRLLHAYNTATIPDPRPCLSTCLPRSRCRSTPGSSTLPDSRQQTHQ